MGESGVTEEYGSHRECDHEFGVSLGEGGGTYGQHDPHEAERVMRNVSALLRTGETLYNGHILLQCQ